MIEAANAASRKKETYLRAMYGRMAARRGRKRSLVAVARTILESVYHMLKDGRSYQELGADYFTRRNPAAVARKWVRRIQKLGFEVTLTNLPQAV